MNRTVMVGFDGKTYSNADEYAKKIINKLSEKNLTYEDADFVLERARDILKSCCKVQKCEGEL